MEIMGTGTRLALFVVTERKRKIRNHEQAELPRIRSQAKGEPSWQAPN